MMLRPQNFKELAAFFWDRWDFMGLPQHSVLIFTNVQVCVAASFPRRFSEMSAAAGYALLPGSDSSYTEATRTDVCWPPALPASRKSMVAVSKRENGLDPPNKSCSRIQIWVLP